MKRESKKANGFPWSFPAWKAEVREYVHVPRRSTDAAATYICEPEHVAEAALGSLYIAGHIEDAAPYELRMLQALALEIRRAYYHDHQGHPLERFRSALREANAYVERCDAEGTGMRDRALRHPSSTPLRRHIIVAVLSGDTLLAATAGAASAYLIRNGRMHSLFPTDTLHDGTDRTNSFAQFARGRIAPEDRILLTTPHFTSAALLKQSGGEFAAQYRQMFDDLVHHWATHESGDEDTGRRAASAVVLRIIPRDATPVLRGSNVRRIDMPSPLAPQPSSVLHEILSAMRFSSAEKPSDEYRAITSPALAPIASRYLLLLRRHVAVAILTAFIALLGSTQLVIEGRNNRYRTQMTANLADAYTQMTLIAQRPEAVDESHKALTHILDDLKKLRADAGNGWGNIDAAVDLVDSAVHRVQNRSAVSPESIAEFSGLAIEFSPRVIVSHDNSILIAHQTPLQIGRIKDGKMRLLLTGVKAAAMDLVARTQEPSPRFAYVGANAIGLLDPITRQYSERLIRLPKGFDQSFHLFAGGAWEVFVIATSGRIARARIDDKATTVTFAPMPLPDGLAGTSWKAAGVLSPSLYLLSTDNRLVRIVGGEVVSDTVLTTDPEPMGDHVALVGLAAEKRVALLDNDHDRIIIVTPDGDYVRQYRHALLSDAVDVISVKEGSYYILTATKLLVLAQ